MKDEYPLDFFVFFVEKATETFGKKTEKKV